MLKTQQQQNQRRQMNERKKRNQSNYYLFHWIIKLCLIINLIEKSIPIRNRISIAFSPSKHNHHNSHSRCNTNNNNNNISFTKTCSSLQVRDFRIGNNRLGQTHIGSSKDEDNNETKEDTFKKLSNPNLKRGSTYGKENNSTIPQPSEVAARLGIKPTKDASKKEWQTAWKLLKFFIPKLHMFDKCKPPDSKLNLACMWWKAISGNDRSSPICDDGLSYDILPSGFRMLVNRWFCRFYPRLHHANVELRTAYLDGAIKEVIDNDVKEGKKIRLVCLGAGYDLRSIKLLERKWIHDAVELDLKQVVEAKYKLIGPERLIMRRPWLKNIRMPKLIPSDLNDIDKVREQLKEVLQMKNDSDRTSTSLSTSTSNIDDYHTIFVFEGVMIYLNEGIPSALLNATSTALKDVGVDGSLCFADRLENIPGGDYDLGIDELNRNGWKLTEWCPKPGLARHMGRASLA